MLFTYTLCTSYSVAFIINHKMITDLEIEEQILISFIITSAITSFFTFYSLVSTTNLTKLGSCTMGLGLVVVIFAILVYGLKLEQMQAGLYSLYALLFTLYFIYDTQLILGKHKKKYRVDEFIVASLNIYIDLVQIFLSLLELLFQ